MALQIRLPLALAALLQARSKRSGPRGMEIEVPQNIRKAKKRAEKRERLLEGFIPSPRTI